MDDWEERSAGTRDAATVLPFLAAALLTPPVILVFAAPAVPWGVPLILVYVFAVWAATILAGFLLARRLKRTTRPQAPDGDG